VEVDLWRVPGSDSARSTPALEHGPAQSRIDFLPQVDGGTAQPLSAYLSPWHLLGGSSEKDLILAGACTDEGSGVQSEEIRGSDVWACRKQLV
jgi:hypothetical protein